MFITMRPGTWRLAMASLTLLLASTHAAANGEIGEHVNDLQAHIGEYSDEVNWLIARVDEIVVRYDEAGAEAATPAALVDHWEAVKFHAAIETNYVPIYSSIWQGLMGVRMGIESEQPIDAVKAQQASLEHALWQALGAVKLAASLQKNGALRTASEESGDESPQETLIVISQQLDRVVAKYAEQLPDEAVAIVHDTYLSRFEGVEGSLIEQDAELVEDLEIDFNVTLPKAIESGSSVDAVRSVVQTMQAKLDTASGLLDAAQSQRSKVF